MAADVMAAETIILWVLHRLNTINHDGSCNHDQTSSQLVHQSSIMWFPGYVY